MTTKNQMRTRFRCVYPPLPRSIWIHPNAPEDDYDRVCRSIRLKANCTNQALDTRQKLHVINVQVHSSDSDDSKSIERNEEKQLDPEIMHVDTARTQQHQQEHHQPQQSPQTQQQQQWLESEKEPLSKESRHYRFYRPNFKQPHSPLPPPVGPLIETETRPEEQKAQERDEENMVTKDPKQPSPPVPVAMDTNTRNTAKGLPAIPCSRREGAAAHSSQEDLSPPQSKLARYLSCESEDEAEASSSSGDSTSSDDSVKLPRIRSTATDSDETELSDMEMEGLPQDKEQTSEYSIPSIDLTQLCNTVNIKQKVAIENTTKQPTQGPREIPVLVETKQDQKNRMADPPACTKICEDVGANATTEVDKFSNAKQQEHKQAKNYGLHNENAKTKTENKPHPGSPIWTGAQKPVENCQTPKRFRQAHTPAHAPKEESSKDEGAMCLKVHYSSAVSDVGDKVEVSNKEETEDLPEDKQTSEYFIQSFDLSQPCNTVDIKQKAAKEKTSKKPTLGPMEIPVLVETKQDQKNRMADPSVRPKICKDKKANAARETGKFSDAKLQKRKQAKIDGLHNESVKTNTENKPHCGSSIWTGVQKTVENCQRPKRLRQPHTTPPKKERSSECIPLLSKSEFPQLCNTVDAKRKAEMKNPPKKRIQGPWEIPLLAESEQDKKKELVDPPVQRKICEEPKLTGSPHWENVSKTTEHKPYAAAYKPVVDPQPKTTAPVNAESQKKDDKAKQQRVQTMDRRVLLSVEFPRLCNTVDAKRRAEMKNQLKKKIEGPWEIPLLAESKQDNKKKLAKEQEGNDSHYEKVTKRTENKPQGGPSICAGALKPVVDPQTPGQPSQLLSAPVSCEPAAAKHHLAPGVGHSGTPNRAGLNQGNNSGLNTKSRGQNQKKAEHLKRKPVQNSKVKGNPTRR